MKWLYAITVIVFAAFACDSSIAANNADQTVTYEVQAITEFSVSGNPGALVVNFAVAGFEPATELDASTSYALTTNSTSKKVVGSMDSAMPSNVSLLINLTAPSGASSAGWTALSTSSSNLVTSINTAAQSGLTISYRLNATVAAGVVVSAQKTVTLTVSDDA